MALMVEKEYVPTYVIHYLGVRIFFWTYTAMPSIFLYCI